MTSEKILPLKIESRDSFLSVTSKDFPVAINDTIYSCKYKQTKKKSN